MDKTAWNPCSPRAHRLVPKLASTRHFPLGGGNRDFVDVPSSVNSRLQNRFDKCVWISRSDPANAWRRAAVGTKRPAVLNDFAYPKLARKIPPRHVVRPGTKLVSRNRGNGHIDVVAQAIQRSDAGLRDYCDGIRNPARIQ